MIAALTLTTSTADWEGHWLEQPLTFLSGARSSTAMLCDVQPQKLPAWLMNTTASSTFMRFPSDHEAKEPPKGGGCRESVEDKRESSKAAGEGGAVLTFDGVLLTHLCIPAETKPSCLPVETHSGVKKKKFEQRRWEI